MRPLRLERPADRPLQVVAVGAHADDVEIGAGGLLAQLAAAGAQVRLLVLSGTPERAEEARASAAALLGPSLAGVAVRDLPDGRFPAAWAQVKDEVEALAAAGPADLVVGPRRADAHQDHRVLAEVLPTAFRSHVLLGYEIPKRDGEGERGDLYVPLTREQVDAKAAHVREAFPSQAGRSWMDAEVFRGLARLRGLECGHDYAEAYTCPAAVLTLG